MHSFTDKSGRAWEIALDVFVARRIKQACGMPIETMIDPSQSEKWDRVAIFDALCAACQPDKSSVTIEQFGKQLSDGDVAEAAAQALLEEVIDFLPQQRRSLMRSLLEKTRTIQQPMMDAMKRAADLETDRLLAQLQNYSSSSSQGSQVSILPDSTSLT